MRMGNDDNKSLLVVVVLVLVLVVGGGESGTGTGTRVGFYSESCSRAESIIRSTVEAHVAWEPSVAAALLRLHFHDCFVRGCDASILIAGPHTELASGANKDLKGAVEVIEEAKKYVEGTCRGVVSCADILALAARDSVVLSGGLSWDVPTGRRDGRVSKESEPSLNLAGPDEPVSVLKRKFARKGLNSKDLVALVGAHTIGTAGCTPVIARLGGANGTEETDPSINPKFLSQLRKLCPRNETNRRVALDLNSQFKFDTSYFANLKNGLGILRSDQALWTDASTRPFVQSYLATDVFNLEFAKSMVKMSNIGVNTGSQGEIRRICSAIN